MHSPTAVAIRHIAFEDLGSFAGPLEAAGYRIRYVDAASEGVAAIDPLAPDLLVVLGGPVGVYDAARYPFLADEVALLRRRLAADLPTLGICLGAQLMAAALDARVYASGGKEIGWAPVTLRGEGAGLLAPLDGVPVLHWHGDTFEVPAGCTPLASTAQTPNQAFARGAHILALQFHPEVLGGGFERWLVGHAAELDAAGIDPRALRDDAARHAAPLEAAAGAWMGDWLQRIARR
ncbi:glutamine amidotransferase [Sphingomonas sp. ac-8]|uniref:glutamine amidotransferase n=1 Tax=Sphingomonas sp. ac-8 TaxID=3242977 RepID=UPI003A813558